MQATSSSWSSTSRPALFWTHTGTLLDPAIHLLDYSTISTLRLSPSTSQSTEESYDQDVIGGGNCGYDGCWIVFRGAFLGAGRNGSAPRHGALPNVVQPDRTSAVQSGNEIPALVLVS